MYIPAMPKPKKD